MSQRNARHESETSRLLGRLLADHLDTLGWRCRCCGADLDGWDHCWLCGCEEGEERCNTAQRLNNRHRLLSACADECEGGWQHCRCGGTHNTPETNEQED